MRISGKVAVVTGAASGIGRGIAEEFVARGASVVMADIERTALEAAAREVGGHGEYCDVSDAASVAGLAEATLERFGRVDILVNNAGVGSLAPLARMTADDWAWMLGVNLMGTINGVQSFLPHLIANPDGGHVAATTSIGGFAVMPALVPYSVSKFGVVALLEGLKLEMEQAGHDVGVTLLTPGPIRSNIDKSRRNRPAHLAAGGLFDLNLDDSGAFEGGVPWKEARFAGAVLADAIEAGRLYVTTHPEMAGLIYDRLHRVEAGFREGEGA